MQWLEKRLNRVWMYYVLIITTFWILVALVPNKILLEVGDSLLVVLALMVLSLYAPIAWKELQRKESDSISRLLQGIVLAWIGTAFLRSLAIVGRSFGRQAWIIDSPLFTFVLWGLIWSAILHIAAPSADNPSIKMPYIRWTLTVAIVGGLLAAFFLGVQAGLFWTYIDPTIIKPMTG